MREVWQPSRPEARQVRPLRHAHHRRLYESRPRKDEQVDNSTREHSTRSDGVR